MDDVAHGQLDDLAADGARDVGHLNDLGRYVARRGVVADGGVDLMAQCIVER